MTAASPPDCPWAAGRTDGRRWCPHTMDDRSGMSMRSRAGGAVRWVEPVCTAFRRDGTAPGREARARPPEAGRGGSRGEGRAGRVNVRTRARTHTRTHTPPESGCPARLRARRGPGWTAVGSRARPCPSLSRAIGRSGLSGGSRGPRTSGHGQTRRTWLLVSDSHGSGHTVPRWLRRDGRRNGRGERGLLDAQSGRRG